MRRPIIRCARCKKQLEAKEVKFHQAVAAAQERAAAEAASTDFENMQTELAIRDWLSMQENIYRGGWYTWREIWNGIGGFHSESLFRRILDDGVRQEVLDYSAPENGNIPMWRIMV